MIGDALLWVGLWLRQTFCLHRYRPRRSPASVFSWRECSACGRMRDWNQNL